MRKCFFLVNLDYQYQFFFLSSFLWSRNIFVAFVIVIEISPWKTADSLWVYFTKLQSLSYLFLTLLQFQFTAVVSSCCFWWPWDQESINVYINFTNIFLPAMFYKLNNACYVITILSVYYLASCILPYQNKKAGSPFYHKKYFW